MYHNVVIQWNKLGRVVYTDMDIMEKKTVGCARNTHNITEGFWKDRHQ